ncbi:MAG: type II toxin-antitoxin system HicB family antitoxin [Dehalococcoidia bacterium]|nr:type II toxin-antitoxin system HicB family antitoxin [Dehalococcoidia bacterium]
MKTFSATIRKEGGLYIAECSEIGTISQGKTRDEALANLKETTQLYLEEFPIIQKRIRHGGAFTD